MNTSVLIATNIILGLLSALSVASFDLAPQIASLGSQDAPNPEAIKQTADVMRYTGYGSFAIFLTLNGVLSIQAHKEFEEFKEEAAKKKSMEDLKNRTGHQD